MKHTLLTYRIVVEGPLGSGWADWFGNQGELDHEGNTVLHLSQVDRSTFYGLIRALGNLDRTLVSITLEGTIQ